MSDSDDQEQEMTRYACPECGKGFDVAGSPWQQDGIQCPYCGAEIEN